MLCFYYVDENLQDDEELEQLMPREISNLKLLNCNKYVRRRRVQKVIRFRHYGKIEDPVNYSREQLMLFYPWRDEQEDLLKVNAVQKAEQHEKEILANSKPYYHNREIDDLALAELVNEVEENTMEDENTEILDNDLGLIESEKGDQDNLQDSMIEVPSHIDQFLAPKMINDDVYLSVMRQLNEKQRRFVLHILHQIKTANSPFYAFLSGGAGVGKSHAITAIVQTYLRFNAKFPTEHPEEMCVLVSAPTGKAAFNVFGMTLHCTFKLPSNDHWGKTSNLKDDVLNSLRVKLAKTKLFIIDEISMVSVKQLYDIDQRLRQVFSTSEDFGGKSVLVVGHLRQLAPVGGSYVFKLPKHLPLGECVGNHLWSKFKVFELTEIMRQKGEMEFCKALNNMSEGCMDEDDIKLLQSRQITASNKPPKQAIRLFRTNKECLEFNSLIHKSLNTEGFLSTAHDQIQGMLNEF